MIHVICDFYLTQTIQATQPDVVMVELCHSRVNILQLDEQTLLQEAQNINLEKIRTAIKQVHNGVGHTYSSPSQITLDLKIYFQ